MEPEIVFYTLIPKVDGVQLANPAQSVSYVNYPAGDSVIAVGDLGEAKRLVASGEFIWYGVPPKEESATPEATEIAGPPAPEATDEEAAVADGAPEPPAPSAEESK